MDESGTADCEIKSHNWFASDHAARALPLTTDRLQCVRGGPVRRRS